MSCLNDCESINQLFELLNIIRQILLLTTLLDCTWPVYIPDCGRVISHKDLLPSSILQHSYAVLTYMVVLSQNLQLACLIFICGVCVHKKITNFIS